VGNPDRRVWTGDQHVTGYVECKQPNQANLGRVEVSEQLKRYRTAFPNVILTNFLEFRLYRQGDPFGEPVTIASRSRVSINPTQYFDGVTPFSLLRGGLGRRRLRNCCGWLAYSSRDAEEKTEMRCRGHRSRFWASQAICFQLLLCRQRH